MNKVGRNDPCPCGSGKKYKKCCMVKDEERGADASTNAEISASADRRGAKHRPKARAEEIENIFRRGRNHLDRNELDRAARAFRSVLRLDPQHYEALTGLGRCLAETGMKEEARKCFEKALEIEPDYAQARIHLELQ